VDDPSKNTHDASHSGLIIYILCQLHLTTKPVFQSFIQDSHIQYQEAKIPQYIPYQLLLDVEEKIKVLKHTREWDGGCNE
jgi:hypothetical protein